jgi:hypothetical protein
VPFENALVQGQGLAVPEGIRPFRFHGVALSPHGAGGQWVGECPFCGKAGKFSVQAKTTQWRCFSCSQEGEPGQPGGNAQTFLRALWRVSDGLGAGTERLAAERGLVHPDTPERWGVAQSCSTLDWLVPGYGPDGKLKQLYRYVEDPKRPGKRLLLPTPGLSPHEPRHGFHCPIDGAGAPCLGRGEGPVYLCEGPWDGMALWEVLQAERGSPGSVLALPGCQVFPPSWGPLLAGKDVRVLFDNDYPKCNPKTGARTAPAGYVGMQRLHRTLTALKEPPKSVQVLRWGPGGYDVALPSGHDVRDWLRAAGPDLPARRRAFTGLCARLQGPPAEWAGGGEGAAPGTAPDVEDAFCLPCTAWEDLEVAWQSAMEWVDGLRRALLAMLAAALSTELQGDPLWLKVMGPPSCGKTTLAEALAFSRQYVHPLDTMTGLFSGYQADRDGKEDFSPVLKFKNKTVIVKDADTVLQSPSRGKILSEFRALYDRSVRTSYRNKMSRQHEGLNVTVILCGTSSLRQLDASELGERFLDVQVMDRIDRGLERRVNWQALNQAYREVKAICNGKQESRDRPELVRARRLTGGYVHYLRRNVVELVGRVEMDEQARRTCGAFGEFIASMRARPSRSQDELVEREMSTRLNKQVLRLAVCLAAVLNKPAVDREVLGLCRKVALDTARGKVLDLCRHLFKQGRRGAEAHALAVWCNERRDAEGQLLQFLRKVDVVERFRPEPARGIYGNERWRLTPDLTALCRAVLVGLDNQKQSGGNGRAD